MVQWFHSILHRKEGCIVMRKTLKNRKIVSLTSLGLGAAGFLLRLIHNGTGSAVLLTMLTLLSAAALLFAAAVALNLKPRAGFVPNNRPSTALLLELLAALLFLGAAAARLLTLTGLNRWLIGFGGIVSAVCLGAIPVFVMMRKRPPLLLYGAVTLSLILKLIPEFRVWSIDPNVGDYCFRLFAMISLMCVCFHRGEFVLNHGKRRLSVFWCIAGMVFCSIAAADSPWSARIFFLAALLYLGASLWSLMSPPRKRRRAPVSRS